MLGDPGPELMFDDRVYKRGALTLHALRLTVGDAAFFELLRAWTQTHAHGTVTTDDFVDVAIQAHRGATARAVPLLAVRAAPAGAAREPVMVPAAWVTSLTGPCRPAEPVVGSGKSRRTRVFAAHAGR